MVDGLGWVLAACAPGEYKKRMPFEMDTKK